MANPQIENGHVDVANELVDAMARTYLSPSEHKVFWAIMRKTWGWHKKTDRISFTQFEQLTGMSRRHIAPALKRLISRQIITRTGNGQRLEYGIQKDYEQWSPLPEQVTVATVTQTSNDTLKPLPKQVIDATVTQTGNTPLPEQVTKPLPKQVNTKEKKETIQKKKTSSTFEEHVELLKERFPKLDADWELKKFYLYWSEGDRKLKRPKLAFTNWLENAMVRLNKTEGQDGLHKQSPNTKPKPDNEPDNELVKNDGYTIISEDNPKPTPPAKPNDGYKVY